MQEDRILWYSVRILVAMEGSLLIVIEVEVGRVIKWRPDGKSEIALRRIHEPCGGRWGWCLRHLSRSW